MSVLILCRDRTEDVVKLLDRLTASGIPSWAALPSDISLRMKAGWPLEIYLGAEHIAPRLVFGWVSLQARELGLGLLQAFEKCGIPVLNGASVLSEGQSKLINSVVLHQNGYPHANTILVANRAALELLIDDVGIPCVVKPLIGAKGQDVKRIESLSMLYEYAEEFFSQNKTVYLQREIAKPDRDIRVRVIDFKSKFAFYRYLSPDGFTTNLSTGGSWRPCHMTIEMKDLAEQCARLMCSPVCGVDLIELDNNKFSVIEVNTTPAFSWPNDNNVDDVVQLIKKHLVSTCSFVTNML